MPEQEGLEEVEEAGAAAEENPDLAQPLPKRRRTINSKVDTKKIVDNKSLPGNPLQDVPMQMKSQVGLSVQVFVGNKIYVVNMGDQPMSVPVGAFVCVALAKGSLIAISMGTSTLTATTCTT